MKRFNATPAPEGFGVDTLVRAFRQEGMVRVESPPAEAAFALAPADGVLLVALVGQVTVGPRVLRGVRRRRKIFVRLGVDPLVPPGANRLEFPLELARRQPGWTIGSIAPNQLAEHASSLARFVRQQLAELRDRYGDYERFASAVDDGYLSIDLPDLEEAVAYARIIVGDYEEARRVLGEVRSNPDIGLEIADRSNYVASLLTSDPVAAKRLVLQWREDGLRAYDLALHVNRANLDKP